MTGHEAACPAAIGLPCTGCCCLAIRAARADERMAAAASAPVERFWAAVAWLLVPIIERVALPMLERWRRLTAGPA